MATASKPLYRPWMRITLALTVMIHASPLYAEQYFEVDDHQIHYIVIPTTFLDAQIANKYGLSRGKHLALVNVSVLNAELTPVSAKLIGYSINLLGQKQALTFNQVREGPAIYYLAQLRHANEEHHRVFLEVELENGERGEIEFLQKMYFES